MKDSTHNAIARYTRDACVSCFLMNQEQGEGPTSIATLHNFHNVKTTTDANRAINAGREIVALEALTAAVAYAESFTGNGCRSKVPAPYVTDVGFDVEKMARHARAALALLR